eukprot:217698-Chlamydomonas_euryale.AAC.1
MALDVFWLMFVTFLRRRMFAWVLCMCCGRGWRRGSDGFRSFSPHRGACLRTRPLFASFGLEVLLLPAGRVDFLLCAAFFWGGGWGGGGAVGRCPVDVFGAFFAPFRWNLPKGGGRRGDGDVPVLREEFALGGRGGGVGADGSYAMMRAPPARPRPRTALMSARPLGALIVVLFVVAARRGLGLNVSRAVRGYSSAHPP